jgi:hypothetical protein
MQATMGGSRHVLERLGRRNRSAEENRVSWGSPSSLVIKEIYTFDGVGVPMSTLE